MNSCWATSRRRAPASLLLCRTASRIRAAGIPKARSRFGSTVIWYWRTNPPTLATSAMPGTALSSYLRNQSWSDRNSLRSWRSDFSAYMKAQPTPVASGPSAGVTLSGSRGGGLAERLDDPAAGPIEVGTVLEQDVDERVAEERVAADVGGVGHRQHLDRQRIGDLILDDARRLARILRVEHDLARRTGREWRRAACATARRRPPPQGPARPTERGACCRVTR